VYAGGGSRRLLAAADAQIFSRAPTIADVWAMYAEWDKPVSLGFVRQLLRV
jgi:hypothetical protein